MPPIPATELAAIRSLAEELDEGIEAVLDEVRGTSTELADASRETGEAGNGAAALEPLIAFVHIPKTAGGTATNMLAEAYSKAAVRDVGNYLKGPGVVIRKLRRREGGWDKWRRAGGRISVGHVPYALFVSYLPSDTRFMTFLREPVDRVLSHYYRHVQFPNEEDAVDNRPDGGPVTTSSLEEALELELPQLTNLMTRFLCSSSGLPSEPLHAGALEEAQENLSGFAFVGIQERFDESLVLLQRMLGLDLVTYESRHVSEDRPAVDEVSSSQRELILEHNQLDAALYEFALERFEDAAEAAGEQVTGDAERLRGLSADANQRALESAVEFLDRELPESTTRSKPALLALVQEQGVSGVAVKQAARNRMSIYDWLDESGQRVWTRDGEQLRREATELLMRLLPEDGTETVPSIRAAAGEANVPFPALRRAADEAGIQRWHNEAGLKYWTRGPLPDWAQVAEGAIERPPSDDPPQ